MTAETRRDFLKTMGIAAASAMTTAQSYARVAGANETIRVGAIGCGSMGLSHLQALHRMCESDSLTITAVCDVYDKRLQEAADRFSAKPIKDHRQILDSREIDCVLIATPDHWHHRMVLDALDAGKHVYVEKPMTHSIEEAKEVLKKMAGSKLKLQVGVQGMSDDSYRMAHEYIKKGTLGNVVMAHIDYSRNYRDDFWAYDIDPDAQAGRNVNWDAWLGPAPKVPWDPARFFQWRRYWDYSGGVATDLFIHRHTRIIRSVGLTLPDYVVATGGTWNFTDSIAEIPDTFNMQLDYPGGPTVLLVSSLANDTPIRHLIRGHKATLEFTREGFTITPQRAVQEAVIPGAGDRLDTPAALTHIKTGGEDITLHHRNLANAIRFDEPLNCDHMLGYYGLVACNMGVISFRRRKYLKWDAQKEAPVES